jgi:hypothetical protein
MYSYVILIRIYNTGDSKYPKNMKDNKKVFLKNLGLIDNIGT